MNSDGDFLLRGRVVTKEHQAGIYGLEVVVYDKDHLFDDRLGKTFTDEDGRFQLRYRSRDFRDLFERAPDLYIEILDCKGATLHSTADAVLWNAGQVAEIDAVIGQDRLTYHLENLRPLSRLKGGLVGEEKLAVIDRAAELLETRIHFGEMPPLGGGIRPRSPGPGEQVPLSAHFCPAPDILLFDDLLESAWGVLANDVLAIPRYEDVLGAVIYRFNVRNPEAVAAVSTRWTRQPVTDDRAFRAVLEAKRAQLSAQPRDTLIENERLLPVLAAAVVVAGGDTAVENRYLSFLLGQVSALGQLDAVYRAARAALASNPGGFGRFANLLGHVGGTCGPDDGPIFWPPEPEDWVDVHEIWRLEKWQCTAEMSDAVRHGMRRGGRYEIDGVDWGDGCPGATVVITGENFLGLFPDSNRVLFTDFSGLDTVAAAPAAPEDWTDTRIVVALPEEAGPGPVSLTIVGNFVTACGHAIHVPRRGNSVDFSGGRAHVRVFTADGRRGEFGVDPGESVTLRWVVVPDGTEVRLRAEQDGTTLFDDDVGEEGTRDVAIPGGRASLTVCTLTTSNACGGEDIRVITLHGGLAPALEIVGTEVTQAIQYYRADEHLTDPSDWGDDNSLQLVVGKPALVRVYLRSGLPSSYEGGRIASVSGTMNVERLESGTATLLTTLSALPITVEADPDYADERGDLGATLNFLVPANHMSGRMRFRATAQTPSGWFDATASAETTIDVDLEQTLQVAGIMIGYNDPATPPAIPAPGLADLQATAAWTLAAYPVRADSGLTFRVAATLTQTVPLTDPIPAGGGCPPRWTNLMADLREAAAADAGTVAGNWIYYGLLATGIPVDTPGGATGCGGSGVGVGRVGAGPTMGHEVGHALGLAHTPCGGAANVNASYPAYEPYDTAGSPAASIGEYGFEFLSGLSSLHRPDTPDFMSYCSPEWMSAYHHNRLLDLGLLSATRRPIDGAGATARRSQRRPKHRRSMDPEPLINVLAFIERDDEVRLHSVSRLVTKPEIIGGVRTDLAVELLDEAGAVIAGAPAYELPLEGPVQGGIGGDCGCRKMIQALVPNLARGARLQIRRGRDVLWRRDAPQRPINVTALHALLGANGRLQVHWDTEVDVGIETRSALSWSNDDGKSWRVLTVGLEGYAAELDVTPVPGGEVIFKVTVTDGFDSASAVSAAVHLPHKPPTVAMLSPSEGARVRAGGSLRLWGAATDEAGRRLGEDACEWLIGEQLIGTGSDLIIDAPGSGEYRITFRARNRHGTSETARSITAE